MSARARQAGFTLVEALTAMLILSVGIMAVANLIAVATTSNTAANHSTAATAEATLTLERLKAIDYRALFPGGLGGSLTTPYTGSECDDRLTSPPCVRVGNFSLRRALPGVGTFLTRWQVQADPTAPPGADPVLFISVRSESVAPLMGTRSRAEFTAYRTCTVTGCNF
jgi:prepilin-type N-terminal cleavage/methylation domain-containing protein